jgi:hypothetical protein
VRYLGWILTLLFCLHNAALGAAWGVPGGSMEISASASADPANCSTDRSDGRGPAGRGADCCLVCSLNCAAAYGFPIALASDAVGAKRRAFVKIARPLHGFRVHSAIRASGWSARGPPTRA